MMNLTPKGALQRLIDALETQGDENLLGEGEIQAVCILERALGVTVDVGYYTNRYSQVLHMKYRKELRTPKINMNTEQI
jgi:hypothetical protein